MSFAQKNERDLLELYSDILRELRARGFVRSSNSPTGDYAEYLICKRFKLKAAPKSTKSFDASDSLGNNYQIKSRRLTRENKTQLLGVIRDLKNANFQHLFVVIFNEDFSINAIYKMPKRLVEKYAKFSEHQNGHILNMRGPVILDRLVKKY